MTKTLLMKPVHESCTVLHMVPLIHLRVKHHHHAKANISSRRPSSLLRTLLWSFKTLISELTPLKPRYKSHWARYCNNVINVISQAEE